MPSMAAPLSGTFRGDGTDATVGAAFLNWCTAANTSACSNGLGGGTFGNFTLSLGTGSFVPLNGGGNTNTITDLNNTNAKPGNTNDNVNFISLTGLGAFTISLQIVGLGTGGTAACGSLPAPGQTCTPVINGVQSAFTLTNSQPPSGGITSTAQLLVSGTASDGNPADNSTWFGIVSNNFPFPYQSLLSAISAGGTNTGVVDAPWTGSFNFSAAVVPEPMTMSLVGVGLLGLGIFGRRKLRK